MAAMAVYEAKSMRPNKAQNSTFTQTEIIGVPVNGEILCIYFEKGNISSDVNFKTSQVERTSGKCKQCSGLSLDSSGSSEITNDGSKNHESDSTILSQDIIEELGGR